MALLVIRPGSNTTVQDQGRVGYREFGVPVGGAFDRGSLDLANALLGNQPDSAALELTLVGGLFRAQVSLAIALAGAPMSALIRSSLGPDRRLVIPQSATLLPGDELLIGGSRHGARAYLAVRGGWQSPLVLGSRSSETRVQAGEILTAESSRGPRRRPAAWPWNSPDESELIRVVDGPDAKSGEASLLESGVYRVSSQSDRMGLRLEGPRIARQADPDRPSSPVAPGAIQVTDGQPIVLGVAGGTMGGYLHLAHIITADLNRLGQLRPGDPVAFRRVAIGEARQIDRRIRVEHARCLLAIRECAADLITGD